MKVNIEIENNALMNKMVGINLAPGSYSKTNLLKNALEIPKTLNIPHRIL